jgi:N-acetylglucosaminyldiphosphoundecaprenol N-acetyl-beta-D-mannosaminyltransferase
MRKLGLEWTHRMVQEPRRLVKRYLIDGVPFAVWLLTRSAITGLFGGSHRRSPDSTTLNCERS